MANVNVTIVGPPDYDRVIELYNQVFQPPRDVSFLELRLGRRHNPLTMIAEMHDRPLGFLCGYELRPSTYYSWLYGVVPDARRQGVASQLMEAEHAWARENGYEMLRFECYNQHRPMLILAIHKGYDVVGMRWDSRTANNHVIFEKDLTDEDSGG